MAKVAWIGLGVMGYPMAGHIRKKGGHDLTVYNRNGAKAEAWAKEYYQRKRTEGKSHTVAVRALANVWARILYAVWKKKELYHTTTFELARLAHAPRVA